MKTTITDFQPGDIIETPGHVSTRLYSLQGIHCGALNQEDVVELAVIDRSAADAHGKVQRLFVPVEMLCAGIDAGIYTLTHTEDDPA